MVKSNYPALADSVEVGEHLGVSARTPPPLFFLPTAHVCVCAFAIGPRHGSDLACQKPLVPCRPMGELHRAQGGRAQRARRTPFGSIAGHIGTALGVSRGDESGGGIKDRFRSFESSLGVPLVQWRANCEPAEVHARASERLAVVFLVTADARARRMSKDLTVPLIVAGIWTSFLISLFSWRSTARADELQG